MKSKHYIGTCPSNRTETLLKMLNSAAIQQLPLEFTPEAEWFRVWVTGTVEEVKQFRLNTGYTK